MDSISSSLPTSKKPPYYTYTLAYPESMGGIVFYVGKGKGNRIYEHEIYARRATTPNSHKTNIIRKVECNGERIVRTKLAHFENEADAFLYETALIFFMRPYEHLTNLTDGGEGASGGTHVVPEKTKRMFSEMYKGKPGQTISEEGKRRLSELRKGKTLSEEHKQKMSKATKGRPGRPLSEAAKRKISEANRQRPHRTGWHHSEATIQKLRETAGRPKGFHHTEEYKQRISQIHKGKPKSEESNQKRREAHLGKTVSLEARRKMSESAKQRVQHRDVSGRFKPAQLKQIIAPSLWEGYYG